MINIALINRTNRIRGARRRALMRAALCAGALLALSGCAGIPIALQVVAGLASASTLLKNEANCSLADTSTCTMPHIGVPAILTPPVP